MMCDCIRKVDEQLKPFNTQLDVAWTFAQPDRQMLVPVTLRIDRDNKVGPKRVFASFCPFCGEKYK